MIKQLLCKHNTCKVVGSALVKGSQLHQGSMKVFSECEDCGKVFTKIVPVSQFGLSYENGSLKVYMSEKINHESHTDIEEESYSLTNVLSLGKIDYMTVILMMKDLIESMGKRNDFMSKELKYFRNPIKFDDKDISEDLKKAITELRGLDYRLLMNLGDDQMIKVSSPAGVAINKVFNRNMKYKYYDKVQFVEKEGYIIYTRRKNRKK